MLRKIVAVGIAIGLYNALFFTTGFPVAGSWGFLILILSIHSLLWLSFFPKSWSHRHFLAFSLLLLALSSSALALFRASPTDASLLSVLSLGLSAFSLYLLALTHERFGALTEIIAVPLVHLKSWLDSAIMLVSGPKHLPRVTIQAGVIRGLIITFPIAAIIITLLANADPIFNKFSQNLLKTITPNVTLFRRLIGSLIVALLSLPIAFMAIKDQFRSPLNHPRYARHHLDLSIVIGAVSLILAAFLLIQFRYIFASVPEDQLHQFGVNTYSEYVRKGFVEMLLVSVIVYATIGTSFLVYRLNQTRSLLKILNLILLSEAAIFIISILRRVWLYQITHGLTRIRIYGTAFVIMMLALTLVLALRHVIKRHFPWYLAETGLVIFTVLITVLLNPDYLIATKFKPTVNQEIDYVYISRLSASSVDGWLEAYNWAKNVVQNYTPDQSRHLLYAGMILRKIQANYQLLNSQKDWYHTNLTQKEASLILKANIDPQELQNLINYVSDINSNMPESLRQPLDRSQNSPLVD